MATTNDSEWALSQ